MATYSLPPYKCWLFWGITWSIGLMALGASWVGIGILLACTIGMDLLEGPQKA